MTYPRLVEQTDPNSGDLTKITFRPITPDKIEAMATDELKSQFLSEVLESRAVGVTPNTLSELLLSRIEPLGKGEKLMEYNTGPTFISAPFKYRKRDRNMKVGWFSVSAGGANAHAGASFGGITYPSSSWDLTVTVGPSPYATGFKNLARFFITGHFLFIEHYNEGTKAAYNSAHKIVKSVDVDANTATVTVSAVGYTNATWGALDSGHKLPYQPTFGAVSLGANSVSDYESFGVNPPADLSKELLIDWFQNIRTYRADSAEYLDALKHIVAGEVNEYLRDFQQLEMAKRNKQFFAFDEVQLLNQIWFGVRGVGQVTDPTVTDIEALEVALDPIDGTPMERKANLVGIHTQLVEHNRRIDLAGAPLDVDLVLEESHNLKRVRDLDGKDNSTVAWMTDRWTKDNLDQLFTAYLQDLYQFSVTRFVQPGKVMVDGTSIVAFEYTVYEIPREHVRIAIFTHPFFEDKILAFDDDHKARGRMMVAVDFMDIKIGVAASNSVSRQFKGVAMANADARLSKVMKLNPTDITMRSRMIDIEMGDHDRHTIIENFSDACPTLTVSPCRPSS